MAGNIEATPEGIGKFIVERTNEVWEKTKYPYLLSKVSPELMLREVDYKKVLGEGTTLKNFVATLAENIRLVMHPTQKSKVGVVPKDSGFTFEVEPTVMAGSVDERPKRGRLPNQKYVVLQFLTALSKLTEEEIKSVNIPTHILAKLLEDK